jgi:hypothetical protein
MVLPRVPLALFGTGGISAASGAACWLRGGYDIKTASDRCAVPILAHSR